MLFVLALPAFAGSSVPGIKKFYQVDEHVYRGAQPTDEGLKYLAKTGIETVIDLREADERSRAEERVVRAMGMKYINVPMTGLTPGDFAPHSFSLDRRVAAWRRLRLPWNLDISCKDQDRRVDG